MSSRFLLVALALLAAPLAVVHASPRLAEQAPAAVALAGASGALLRDLHLPTARLAGLPIGRLLEEGTRRLGRAGLALTDVDALACAVLDAPQAPLAVLVSGSLDRAVVEADCIARGAVRADVGAVAALRLPGGPQDDALHLSFLPGGAAIVASAAVTAASHDGARALPELQAFAARVPADASIWLVADRAWLDGTFGKGVGVAGDVLRVAAWGSGSPTLEVRLVAEFPSDAAAAASAALWQGIAHAVALTGTDNAGFAALTRARFHAEGTRVLGVVSFTQEELEALP